ncbi:MAG: hypothetical protein MGF17_05305 [Trichodesmium sp. MAG_R04]|nr:hypothetical protein [Trichodesmium sp. MAG_R04]
MPTMHPTKEQLLGIRNWINLGTCRSSNEGKAIALAIIAAIMPAPP